MFSVFKHRLDTGKSCITPNRLSQHAAPMGRGASAPGNSPSMHTLFSKNVPTWGKLCIHRMYFLPLLCFAFASSRPYPKFNNPTPQFNNWTKIFSHTLSQMWSFPNKSQPKKKKTILSKCQKIPFWCLSPKLLIEAKMSTAAHLRRKNNKN